MTFPVAESDGMRRPDEKLLMQLLERVRERIDRGEDLPRRELPVEKTAFPKALFLDTNHWIALSRAHYGKSQIRQHVAALDAVRKAVASARLVAPITVMNLSEASKRQDADSRHRLAEFIVDLSGNFSTLPNSDLDEMEIDEALRKLYFEVPPTHEARRSLVRWGTRSIFSTNAALPESADPRVTRAAHEVGLEPEISVLAIFELGRDRGIWGSVEEFDERGRESLAGIRAIDVNLPPLEKLRRERRNLVAPGGRPDSFLKQLNSRLQDKAIPIAGFHRWLASDKQLELFFEELASWVVPSTLMFERDRSRDAKTHVNDVVDLSFLRVAIPFGNIVATEKSWAHHAKKCRLDQRYQTTIISDLGHLPTLLAREGL